jgi:hypothetical protein
MWILTPSITSAFAAATGELTSASSEQLAAAFARSLLSRSKPSPQRTWLQRLKRDSWTTHLSGAISSDSLGESFTDWWTSSLAATRASHSAQPASDSEPKTQDTSGRLSQPELLQCDQQSAFLRMSKDTFLSGCATCCKTWQDWVTERRGAWRARVNAARLIRGKGSSSWPTIRASEYKDVGPVGSKSHQHMLGKHYLCAVVTQEESNGQAAPVNWSTPNTLDTMPPKSMEGIQRVLTHDGRKNRKSTGNLREDVVMFGQAAPASPNTLGSRQGLLVDWRTPQAQEAGAKVETLFTKDGAPAMPGQRAYRKTPSGKLVLQSQTINQQVEMVQRQELWLTPRANEPDSDPNFAARNADRGAHCHGTLSSQAKREQWATPRTPTGGPESAQRKQELGRTTSGGGDLASQAMTQWPTPLTLAGPTETSNVSGSSEFTRKVDVLLGLRETTNGKRSPTAGRLNPQWVTQLMGLPLGFVSPSCPASVIKNWPRFVTGWLQATTAPTSCDSSGMALCQPSQSEPSDFLLASCGKEPTE